MAKLLAEIHPGEILFEEFMTLGDYGVAIGFRH